MLRRLFSIVASRLEGCCRVSKRNKVGAPVGLTICKWNSHQHLHLVLNNYLFSHATQSHEWREKCTAEAKRGHGGEKCTPEADNDLQHADRATLTKEENRGENGDSTGRCWMETLPLTLRGWFIFSFPRTRFILEYQPAVDLSGAQALLLELSPSASQCSVRTEPLTHLTGLWLQAVPLPIWWVRAV